MSNDLGQKSYDEIVALLQAKAIEFYSDKNWAGLAPFSLDDLLVRLSAEASTQNGQYLDLRSNQAFLATATIYRDVLRIAQNLGLNPRRTVSRISNYDAYG